MMDPWTAVVDVLPLRNECRRLLRQWSVFRPRKQRWNVDVVRDEWFAVVTCALMSGLREARDILYLSLSLATCVMRVVFG